ncbi:hypothetical protein LSH36_745g02063 [Paralvinella palmiformis]|uniref:Uncharacterized protein n=1 Tax=Paralvinella palmiformis TaxID=53620 RepID=A0AAD9MSX0_9ANNE|nr:hypothetical protein LSH36_745g02063 [Paralvinella palmiformis]
MIEEKVNEGISAYREREARKINVIIHMPESKKETDDEEYVLGLAKQIHADNIEIKNIIRLGKKTDDPRPTKVILQTLTQKRTLLQNAKTLKESEKDNLVYIIPDLSAQRREQRATAGNG